MSVANTKAQQVTPSHNQPKLLVLVQVPLCPTHCSLKSAANVVEVPTTAYEKSGHRKKRVVVVIADGAVAAAEPVWAEPAAFEARWLLGAPVLPRSSAVAVPTVTGRQAKFYSPIGGIGARHAASNAL